MIALTNYLRNPSIELFLNKLNKMCFKQKNGAIFFRIKRFSWVFKIPFDILVLFSLFVKVFSSIYFHEVV